MKRCYATHSNWVIVTLVAVVTQFSYSFTLPSMYQFLTSPSTAPAGKEVNNAVLPDTSCYICATDIIVQLLSCLCKNECKPNISWCVFWKMYIR